MNLYEPQTWKLCSGQLLTRTLSHLNQVPGRKVQELLLHLLVILPEALEGC